MADWKMIYDEFYTDEVLKRGDPPELAEGYRAWRFSKRGGESMPFVTIDYVAGVSDQDRRKLQEQLAAVVLEHFAAPASNVRVFTRAMDPADVYVADGNRDGGLPIIRVEFLPGRSLEQKRAAARGLAHAAAEVLHVPVAQIRTILFEKERQDWARGDTLVADA